MLSQAQLQGLPMGMRAERAHPDVGHGLGRRDRPRLHGGDRLRLWRTLKMMPRTKPVQIKPQASQEIAWDDIAGVDDAKAELQEVVEFLRDATRVQASRRPCSQGRAAARPARHRQDAARQGRRARVRRAVLRRSPRRRSSRCSPASAPRVSGDFSPRLASTRRDPVHRRARRRRRAPRQDKTPSVSRRSTSCSSRWTASPPATSSSSPRPTCSTSSTQPCCAPAGSTASVRVPARRGRPRQGVAGAHAQQAAARGHRHGHDRPADERPDRGRAREPVQDEAAIFCARRGGHGLARGRLRRRAGAGRRRRADLHHAQRRTSAASWPITRPAMPCAASC